MGAAHATIYYAHITGNIDTAGQWMTTVDSTGGGVAWATVNQAGNKLDANGKTITVNQNITCDAIMTGTGTGTLADGTGSTTDSAGGGFAASASRTIATDVYAGSTTCLSLSGGASTIIAYTGNLYGSAIAGASAVTVANNTTFNHTNGSIHPGTYTFAHGISMGGSYLESTFTNVVIFGPTTNGYNYGIAQSSAARCLRLVSCNIINLGGSAVQPSFKWQPTASSYISYPDSTGTGTIRMALTPAPSVVLNGYADGVDSTGAAQVGSLVAPPQMKVLTTASYTDYTGTTVSGTYYGPDPANVLSTDSSGASVLVGATTGTATFPDSTGNAVLSSIANYGWGGNTLHGQFHDPGVNNVLSTALYGTSGYGNYYPPLATVVKRGVLFGVSNTGSHGTFAGGGRVH
jgi:hypothetical protein